MQGFALKQCNNLQSSILQNMKTDKTRSSFYTTILATLLREWREQNHITVYSVAKAINASPHTITRFEQLKGGVSLEVGFRYLEYAEAHISHPAIFCKFRTALTKYKVTEEQQIYIDEQKQKQQCDKKKRDEERKCIEDAIRKYVTEELQNEHYSNIQRLNNETQKLSDRIASLERANKELIKERDELRSNSWLLKFKRSLF